MTENQPLKLLLIEDNENDYLLFKRLLLKIEDVSYSLIWARDYAEALEIIKQETFDVYLIDYNLGNRTGLDLLAVLKEKETAMVPIIFLTGIGDRKIDMAAMKAGAADYLVKGQFEPYLLERSIRYAIERTRLINELSELAIRDELTGLYNRREMNRLLEDELLRCERYGRHISLIMLDIDHFKTVNDAYGHAVGDQILQQLANIFTNTIRLVDRCIRFGGEEFMLILPETSGMNALILAERVRSLVEQRFFICTRENQPDIELKITVSMGVADNSVSAKSQEALIDAADQALYSAKAQGRNQTVLFENI